MKDFKNIIVYSGIIFLCIASFAGYVLQNMKSNAATPGAAVIDKSYRINHKSEAEKQKHVEELMKRALAMHDPNPVVGIGRGEDYEEVTKKAVENAGGLKDIIHKGDTVLIKPNICTWDKAGAPTITDYRTVQTITNLALQYGASKVIVAEGTICGNAFDPVNLRISKYGTLKGVCLLDLNSFSKEDCYELKPPKSLTGKALFIPKIYMDADVVIDIAKLKTHVVTKASLSLKNAIGVTSGRIYGLADRTSIHSLGLDEAIIDLNRIRKPDFAMIEGIVGGQGEGPLNNTPVKSNIIFAGKDLVALDTVAITFMGFTVDQVPHVQRAVAEQLGISDLTKIKVNGADLKTIAMRF